ncbi:MAG: hypothetical protein F6J87_30560 [Spirulina sp. SIO3F2]|nr:hypothetical protein [Spirulina sp. SIO3F2]
MMTGLYHPEEFRDNCGFGLIAHMKGDASHKLLLHHCCKPQRRIPQIQLSILSVFFIPFALALFAGNPGAAERLTAAPIITNCIRSNHFYYYSL